MRSLCVCVNSAVRQCNCHWSDHDIPVNTAVKQEATYASMYTQHQGNEKLLLHLNVPIF